MFDVTQVFIILYTIVKDLLPLKLATKNKYFVLGRKIATILLAIILLFIQFTVLLPFILFRFCLGVALKISYGESFGGFLSGMDTLFETNSHKTVVNVIQIYSSKEDSSVLVDSLKDVFSKVHSCSFKLSSSIENVLGYCFYVKNQVKVNDIIDIVTYNEDRYMTTDMLLDYLHKNCETLKKNQMWNVTFFTQPILWNEENLNKEDGTKQFAVICTIRHSLCDGPAIISLFQKYVIQNVPLNLKKKINEKVEKPSVNLDNVMIRRNPVTAKVDGLALKIKGNRDWHIATSFEKEQKLVPIIKKIKEKLQVRFTEVLSAAVSASVNDYVKQRGVKLDNFTVGTPIRLKIEDLIKMQKGVYTFDEINNNFGLLALTLPFNLEERSMKNVIEYIHNYNESLRYSVDPIVAHSFLRDVCTYLPIQMTKYCCNSFMSNMTIGVTNLIGFEKCTFDGHTVNDIFFFVPGFIDTAFIFNIFTYDGRLQITLTSREGFVHTKQELQEILNNTLKYIEKAEQEILTSSTL